MSNQVRIAVRLAVACDPATVKRAETMISEARMSLMLDAPFYGAIALRLTLVANPVVCHGTCATDGHSLYYNPDWIVTLTHKALVGLIAHEVMHIAMKHTLRREGRNPRDWNIACDHAINNDLRDAGYELPEDGMLDRRFRGWSSEEIYPHVARPKVEQPQTGCSIGGGKSESEPGESQSAPGKGGDDSDSERDDSEGEPSESDETDDGESEDKGGAGSHMEEDESEEEQGQGGGAGEEEEQLPAGAVLDSPDPVGDEAQIDVALIEAAMCAKAAGNLPAHLGKLVNSLTRAQVSFHDILAEFMTTVARNDYSMKRANKRYLQAGVYLPALHSEDECGEVAFFIDNSGSINTEQLSLAVNALDDCMQQVQPERVHVKVCDTEVNKRYVFERGEPIKVDVDHGGGTDLCPPFEELESEGITPMCALYFTDGCGRYPDKEPPYPVLWMMTCDHHPTPPFGTVIRVSDVKAAP